MVSNTHIIPCAAPVTKMNKDATENLMAFNENNDNGY